MQVDVRCVANSYSPSHASRVQATHGTTSSHDDVSDPSRTIPSPPALSLSRQARCPAYSPQHLLPGAHVKLERLGCPKHEHDRAPQTEPAHLLRGRERLAIEQEVPGG